MHANVSGLACAVDDDRILIFGGYDGVVCASSGEVLSFGSAHTSELPSLPAPRFVFCLPRPEKATFRLNLQIFCVSNFSLSLLQMLVVKVKLLRIAKNVVFDGGH